MAVGRKRPGGHIVSFKELRARVNVIESSDYRRRGEALPGLIRDLYTTLAAGRDVAGLLDLAVMVHAQTTRGWLYVVGAPLDLRREAATLAQRMAEERDDPAALGVAAWGAVNEMVAAGAFDLAQDELHSVTVPTNRPESMQLAGMLALSGSLVAAADKRPGDADAALEYAAELAQPRMTLCGRFASPRSCSRCVCFATRSLGRSLGSWSRGPGGMRWARSCGVWLTGLVCPYSFVWGFRVPQRWHFFVTPRHWILHRALSVPVRDSLYSSYAQAVDAGLAGLAPTVSCRVRETNRRSASWRSWINATNP